MWARWFPLLAFILFDKGHWTSAKPQRRLVLGVDGGTESVRACFFDATNGEVVGRPCSVSYRTTHPSAGWAEQNPNDWWTSLGGAIKEALHGLVENTGYSRDDVVAMAVDTTCCSVIALDAEMQPLRDCLLWMDQRSAKEASLIMQQCRGDPALAVNGGGNGPLSAEWMTCKALWLKTNERESTWDQAMSICEYQDFINYKLTGTFCASSCNAATRWHWDGEECLRAPTEEDPVPSGSCIT